MNEALSNAPPAPETSGPIIPHGTPAVAPPSVPAEIESDSALMERARTGQQEAYTQLFERHAERIWSLAHMMLHDSAASDDILQETFLRGWTRAGSFRGDSEPRSWLVSIALNACRKLLLKRKTLEHHSPSSLLQASGRPLTGRAPHGPLTSVIRRERYRRLTVALGYLTELQRTVFALHYGVGVSYEDIGIMLAMKAGAARAAAHRAKAVLRSKMDPDELQGKELGIPPFEMNLLKLIASPPDPL
jgi:RNA polymerase sigma-70 factor (ECF subfamily)